MRELKPANTRRLHMHSEGAAHRRAILAEFCRRPPVDSAHIWLAPLDGRPERAIRDGCFRKLVPGVLGIGASDLLVESCSQDRQDHRVIANALTRAGALGRTRFGIVPATAHEML